MGTLSWFCSGGKGSGDRLDCAEQQGGEKEDAGSVFGEHGENRSHYRRRHPGGGQFESGRTRPILEDSKWMRQGVRGR